MERQVYEMRAIKEIIDTCVGQPLFTYEAQLNAERPKGNYAAVKCIRSLNPGFDEVRTVVSENDETCLLTRGVRILTFDIMFNRDGEEYIKFDNSFYRTDVMAVLKKWKFAALGKETLNLASLVLETNWEVRKAVRMQFNCIREEVSKIDSMDGAKVFGTFYDGKRVISVKEP